VFCRWGTGVEEVERWHGVAVIRVCVVGGGECTYIVVGCTWRWEGEGNGCDLVSLRDRDDKPRTRAQGVPTQVLEGVHRGVRPEGHHPGVALALPSLCVCKCVSRRVFFGGGGISGESDLGRIRVATRWGQ
jgi:hypothetical protein